MMGIKKKHDSPKCVDCYMRGYVDAQLEVGELFGKVMSALLDAKRAEKRRVAISK